MPHPPSSTMHPTRGRGSRTCAAEFVNPLKDGRWETWLAEYPDASVFHTTAWARVLADTYGFEPHYLAARLTDERRLLLPVVEVHSWLTGRRGISLPFSDFCDPLGSGPEGLPEPVFTRLRRHAEKHRWRYLETRGGLPAVEGASASQSYYCHELPLEGGEAAVFNALHPSVRRAVRKAEKSGLTVEIVDREAPIEAFFGLVALTRRRHGLPPQPIEFFRAIRTHVLQAGLGFLVLARKDGEPAAGVVFFHRGQRALFKFGASDERFQNLRPTNLVLWTAIRECLRRGITGLHFGRNAPQHESLRRFKLSWGTREDQITYTKFNLAEQRFCTDRNLLSGWQNRIFRRLPIPVGRCLGRLLYRHIA